MTGGQSIQHGCRNGRLDRWSSLLSLSEVTDRRRWGRLDEPNSMTR
jgi:hypothetical protein